MVVLQNEPAPLTMAARVVARPKLEFDLDRELEFEIRSIAAMASRPYNFEAFRILHYDIILEDAVSKREKAKELNVQGVKLYKEGKLDEALWCFEKALSIDPEYENAKKNQETLNAKRAVRKARVDKETKEGKSFAQVSREMDKETAATSTPVEETDKSYRPEVKETYQGPSRDQSGYAKQDYQQKDYQQAGYAAAPSQQQPQRATGTPAWNKNFRCPGCSIPVKEDWVMCTNCGTDLRQYPPIPY